MSEVFLSNPLFGSKTKMLVFGEKSNMPLYGNVIWAKITIGFEDGLDLDILGYWLGSDPKTGVGFGYTTQITREGLLARWSGDNTRGGPEYIKVGIVSGVEVPEGSYVFRIHFNWFRLGDGHSGGGAIVLAKDWNGNDIEVKSTASHRYGNKANTDDPYVDVEFTEKGEIVDIRLGNQGA